MDIFNGVLQYLLKINDTKQIERDCHSKVRIRKVKPCCIKLLTFRICKE